MALERASSGVILWCDITPEVAMLGVINYSRKKIKLQALCMLAVDVPELEMSTRVRRNSPTKENIFLSPDLPNIIMY